MWLEQTLRWLLLLDAMTDPSLSAWQRIALTFYVPEQNKR
jgi:hypothetical protein